MSRTYLVPTSQGNVSIWDSEGLGKPVLFLHGQCACKEVFSRQFGADLAHKYRFIAMDLSGQGESERAKDPKSTYSYSGYADIAIEVLKELEIDNPIVVGWSLGGHIALNMIQKAHKIAGVLITGTPPINISKEGVKEGFLVPLVGREEFSREDAIEFISASGFNAVQYPFIVEAALKVDGRVRSYLVESIKNGVGGNQKELVETDDTPLCIVQGEEDPIINNRYIIEKVNYKNLFHNRVYVVKHAGHAVFWKNPQEFNKIMFAFLSSL